MSLEKLSILLMTLSLGNSESRLTTASIKLIFDTTVNTRGWLLMVGSDEEANRTPYGACRSYANADSSSSSDVLSFFGSRSPKAA